MSERHIVVDPFLIAVPDEPDEYSSYVEMLVKWLSCLSTHRKICSISEEAVFALWDSGHYPTRERLGSLLQAAGIQHVGLLDVLNLLRVLAEVQPFLEHHLDVRTATHTDLEISPEKILERQPGEVGSRFGTALLVAGWAQNNGWASRGLRVATSEDGEWATSLYITGRLTLVERLNGDLVPFDAKIMTSVGLLFDPDCIDDDVCLEDIWQDVAKATAWMLKRRIGRAERVGVTLPRVTCSPSFVESMEAYAIPSQRGTLETVFQRIVLAAMGRLHEVKGAKLHPVREGAGAEEPQVTRSDGAKLWRCMVTQRGAGFRLHYWEYPDGSIEVDRVMVESDV